jgi:hypothetical protein
MKSGQKVGWGIVILLAVITSASALHRVVVVHSGSVDRSIPGLTDRVDTRYNQSAILTYSHLLPGLVFMIVGPLQFSKRLRARWLGIHRWFGRIFLTVGVTAAIFGMVMAAEPSTYIGVNAIAATYFFGSIFLFCATKAYYHIRRKQILLHREWMIRTFAIGIGVSMVRIVAAPLFILMQLARTSLRLEDIMGTSFWIGWGISMIAAEIWIAYSRARFHAIA